MHNFEQVKDVLDYGKMIHTELRKFYESLNKQNGQARAKMLLDYLSRHESHLEETLERFEAENQHNVLDTWMQYAPSIDIQQIINGKCLSPDMSVDEVVKLALEFDEAVVELYREATNECDVPHVKEVFQSLVELENQEKVHLLRASLFEDM